MKTIEAILTKTLPHAIGRGEKVVAIAKLCQLDGNQRPYFSLTGEHWNGRTLESCGQIHDELLRHWPELQPLSKIHLSDDDGTPMHAVENGWYWAGGCKEWCKGASGDPPRADILARHLRINPLRAQAIVQAVINGEINKEDFIRFVNAQKERWAKEAQEAIALIESLAQRNSELEAA